jgi:hypothetical protein
MRKYMFACMTTVIMTLCLSIFLIDRGRAEDGMKANVTQNDSLPTVAMHDAVLSFTDNWTLPREQSMVGSNENPLRLVLQGGGHTEDPEDTHKKEPCKDAQCAYRPFHAGDKAVDGSSCNSGVVCMVPNAACMSNTGRCKTVNVGGGQCACPCVPQ